MTPEQFRLAYICEFLLALVAVFTAWSEIGGQTALDLMHWGWKLGFGIGLSGAVVGYTAAVVSNGKLMNWQTARWVTLIVLLLLGMGVVTYYYTLEGENGDSEDSGTVSIFCAPKFPLNKLS